MRYNAVGKNILCIGEILWDAMPEGLFLGGAPFNVCYHINMLDISGQMVSRIGNDRFGWEALRRIKRKGLSTQYIQQDDAYETGFVEVDLHRKDGPGYNIIRPVAWDYITYTDDVDSLAGEVDIVVFGTLAQRNEVSRNTIQRLCARKDLFKVFDVNLRPPDDSQSVVEAALKAANIVKLNDEELFRLADWFGYQKSVERAAEKLASAFDCDQICITRGKDGASLYNRGTWVQQPGINVAIVDTVGSGDAFLAAFTAGLLQEKTDEERLLFANIMGTFVATKSGATPSYSMKEIIDFAREKGLSVNGLRV